MLITILILLGLLDFGASRDHKQFGYFGILNSIGILDTPCTSSYPADKEPRVGQCQNIADCSLNGGKVGGVCSEAQGVCCLHINNGKCGEQLRGKFGYFYNAKWPQRDNTSHYCPYTVKTSPNTCFIRIDILTLEMSEKSGSCVHDRFTVMGGKEPSGQMCGQRSGEVTLVEVERGQDITLLVQTQGGEYRYQFGITQISCSEVRTARIESEESTYNGTFPCGEKNPSLNKIGKITLRKKNKPVTLEDILKQVTKAQEEAKEKTSKGLKDISGLGELELEALKRDIYKPSFPRLTNHSPWQERARMLEGKDLGRVLYGNETDTNEYPWQISMWLDRSHFCGGSLINENWVLTAAHCVDLQYRNHFQRVTVSLSDHNVKIFNETKNIFRKLKRIVRFPTYDEHYLHGDLALLQFETPVEYSASLRPVCLPKDEYDWGYRTSIITGWGYDEQSKNLVRPTTTEILKEAEQYILPQDVCIKYSPFPITDRMICTFKGPLGIETTCQGDSGGPLVVNNGTNKFVLVGATSFGVSTCEGPYPSMFARVSSFLDFIYAAMVPTPMEYLINYESPRI
ncbi:transmembrane protease serine 11A [Eurytemora carolleeae]|uniref:transmembrane protease serine 11A n=1 Tax=Eurytemora carolleeae TaxID=1294199 RepID=UPI000C793CA1|nr:transmembrane protease serine 11A [Eurytemora carolleeae]|eukprot:XP_023342069.1 transmembrane protease serine 11A-like [Eurytemora affinis]